MRGITAIGCVALVAAGCSFNPGSLTSGDAGSDAGGSSIKVGFGDSAVPADEAVGTVTVRVVLSQPVADTVTVDYAVTGGTATANDDFTGGNGTLTFAPNIVEQTFDIAIVADNVEESDETIELTLSSPSAGASLALATTTITISANVLPRVTFAATTSSGAETSSPTIDVVLDTASQLATSVDVTVMSGTATGGGVDYTFATTTVDFAAGETLQQIALPVVDDSLDEDAETVVLELTNPSGIIVGTDATHTHTINDNDAPPDVDFALATSSVGEAGTSIDITVSLSAPSGKAITVPFTVANSSTATETSDYTLGTASPLAFAAGDTSKTITVDIVQDTALEGPETVVLDLGTPTNATLGTTTTHTLTIVDDDTTCVGTGATAVCVPVPSATASISGSFNTDTSMQCAASQPTTGWTGGPNSCFVVGTTVTIGATTVTGSRPLVVIASGDLTVNGTLDAASHVAGGTGPGALACNDFQRAPTNSQTGAGGGAGGTFRTKAGNGGNGDNITNTGGLAADVGDAPTVLRGGCAGENGGKGNTAGGNNGGIGGDGGGAVYLAAVGTLTITGGTVVNVSGAGATAQVAGSPDNGAFAGGGGGGSGGMLLLFAGTFDVSGAKLVANGGGGSSGGDNNAPGMSGSDPSTTNINTAASGGPVNSGGAAGGNGFAGSTQATSGGNGGTGKGGGGGGGGGGYVKANAALTGASVSAGHIAAP